MRWPLPDRGMLMTGINYFLSQLINGLSLGGMYAVIAIGYSMVYSILYLMNFAHGDLYIFGTFIAYSLYKAGLPMAALILAAGMCGGLLAMLIERAIYRPVRNANRIVPMVSALGAALVLRTIAQAIWGTRTLVFPPLFKNSVIMLGDLQINSTCLISLGLAAACVIVFTLLINFTKVGKATLCVIQDIKVSSLMGIPVNSIIPFVYFLGGFFGVLGGVMMSTYYSSVSIEMGLWGTCKAWAASQLGGVGSFYGAFLGGLLLGVVETLASAYIGSGFKDSIGYLAIVLILVFRPQGLFGKEKAVKV